MIKISRLCEFLTLPLTVKECLWYLGRSVGPSQTAWIIFFLKSYLNALGPMLLICIMKIIIIPIYYDDKAR